MDELIAQLNNLATYPSVSDLHTLAVQLQAYTQEQINDTLLPALTNKLLVDDIKRLMSGALPSTMIAPICVQPTAPNHPDYPAPDKTTDPASATGEPPTIKPIQ